MRCELLQHYILLLREAPVPAQFYNQRRLLLTSCLPYHNPTHKGLARGRPLIDQGGVYVHILLRACNNFFRQALVLFLSVLSLVATMVVSEKGAQPKRQVTDTGELRLRQLGYKQELSRTLVSLRTDAAPLLRNLFVKQNQLQIKKNIP